jgi:hypothetical protein
VTLIESADAVDLGGEIQTPPPERFPLGNHTITIAYDLVGDLAETAWELYLEQFRELDGIALQRHLMTRPEFFYLCRLSAVQKWLVHASDGTLIGLATYSNNLSAMPLVSPTYFQRRWPEQFEQETIWYCGFVCVDSPDRSVFPALIRAMYDQAAKHGGVIALDYCAERGRLASVVDRMLSAHGGPGYRGYCADRQSYWVYETADTARAVA